jgi:hypothetical protein
MRWPADRDEGPFRSLVRLRHRPRPARDRHQKRRTAPAQSLPGGRHFHLFQNRPKWRQAAAVGKTVVSSAMIDRVTAKLGRKLYEVPVGFKWFVDGLLDGSLGFGGEESAGATFLRWTAAFGRRTRMASSPVCSPRRSRRGRAAIPAKSTASSRANSASRSMIAWKRPPRRRKRPRWRSSPRADQAHRAGGRKNPGHPHPRPGQRCAPRRIEGGDGKRLVRGASVRAPRTSTKSTPRVSAGDPFAPDPGRGPDDRQRDVGRSRGAKGRPGSSAPHQQRTRRGRGVAQRRRSQLSSFPTDEFKTMSP